MHSRLRGAGGQPASCKKSGRRFIHLKRRRPASRQEEAGRPPPRPGCALLRLARQLYRLPVY